VRGSTEAAVEIRPAMPATADACARRAAPSHPQPRRLRKSARNPESCTDGELVTLALNGGATAFAHLIRRHARHLRSVIARRLRDPEDVRDVIQDTHLAVWRALQHYDARRPFEAWITTIALNKCRDSVRRRAAQLGMLSRLRSEVFHEAWSAFEERGIERLLIGREDVRSLGRALQELPPQLRGPLVLTTVREHSQDAAAAKLGLTRKAVEMRVRRARQQLARALEAARA
jgi:RNA polymerase sigma factor CnrH